MTPVVKRKDSFKERFVGRTSNITRDGDRGVVSNAKRPIQKLDETNSSLYSHLHITAGTDESPRSGHRLVTPRFSLSNHRNHFLQTPNSSFGGVADGISPFYQQVGDGNKIVVLNNQPQPSF